MMDRFWFWLSAETFKLAMWMIPDERTKKIIGSYLFVAGEHIMMEIEEEDEGEDSEQ